MPDIKHSGKFHTGTEQRYVYSDNVVFMRLVLESDGWKVMTATAGEDRSPIRAYEDQGSLVCAAVATFEERGLGVTPMLDLFGRPYVEVRGLAALNDAHHLATHVLHRLGIVDFDVVELRHLLDLHDDLAVEEGEDAYLSDGMWMTSDGRLVEK